MPAPTAATYSLRDVCALWGRSERWFRRHRQQLEAEGFPKPKTFDNPRRTSVTYFKDEVDRYFARQADPLREDRAMLERKYGAK
jgi:hypothetical protein